MTKHCTLPPHTLFPLLDNFNWKGVLPTCAESANQWISTGDPQVGHLNWPKELSESRPKKQSGKKNKTLSHHQDLASAPCFFLQFTFVTANTRVRSWCYTYTLVSLLANFVGRTICTTLVYNNNNNNLFMHCNLGTHNDWHTKVGI